MHSKLMKAVASLVGLSLLVSVAAGCGTKKGTDPANTTNMTAAAVVKETTEAEDPLDKLPKEVSVLVLDRGDCSADEGSYEENRWTKWINQDSGINVKWVPIPRSGSFDKINLLVAAGEAPDIVWEFDRSFMAKLIDNGFAQPVDEYIEKYSTTYKRYLSENPELKPFLMQNGDMYIVSAKRGTNLNYCMWIRQDWLDKLNLKVPTTDEELFNVAKAFKDNDPDGNGKNDTLGFALTGNRQMIYNWYFTKHDQWFIEDGKAKYGATLDRFADGLAFFKRSYDEGLIDPEFYTDTTWAKQKQYWVTGKAGIYLSGINANPGSANTTELIDLKKNVPTAKLSVIPTVTTKYGTNGLYQETWPNKLLLFSKDMKNPKAAMQLLDWMMENGADLQYGHPDVHYRLVNNVPQTIDADKYKKEVGYAHNFNLVWPVPATKEILVAGSASDAVSQEDAQLRGDALAAVAKFPYRRDLPYSPTMSEVQQTEAQFNPIRKDIEAKVIISGKDFTVEMAKEKLQSEWKRLGGENAEKLVTEWYEKNKVSFEIK